ncbi:sensor histidine kinase [Lapillicoccus jejuensis]|uniref:histidine kinase n=1 Tax=Lapillicoccus jejuensis TaxID=402171 RepID=A0A542DYM2_9MICO|nr:sensor histidine kinase [Lapillicoccus jejuensis]TQJ08201.1 signal transduction histidine kinase [Lapillicoccus jejuensis]
MSQAVVPRPQTVTRDAAGSLRGRVAAWFALDDLWERPVPPAALRRDLLFALATFALAVLGLELARGAGIVSGHAVWAEYLGLVVMTAPVVTRRVAPVPSAVGASLAFFAVGLTLPDVAAQVAVQVVYFVALFSGMAWARNRRVVLVAMGAVLLLMFGWLTVQFSLGSTIDEIRRETQGRGGSGLLGPIAATVVYAFVLNVVYFGGAVLGGQAAWRAARARARLADQAGTLADQAQRLREHAVVQERLRIARELHDVVAHHVSVMGVQAAAARRVMDRDPAAAAEALGSVEESAREAVTQMRSLVGTLREGGEAGPATRPGADGPTDRSPEPGLGDLPRLVEEARRTGLDVGWTLVERTPGCAAQVGPSQGLALYRTVQEALSNVRRHSTARAVRVVLRVDPQAGFAEVEVLDDGRPRSGTSGSGLGVLGMRERVRSLGGAVEVGPRVMGGYRVRVRLPLGSGS